MKPLPDILEIQPLTKPPNCTITVPGSKSITNRALILAALSDGKCTLRGALWADDTQVMVDSLQKLGFEINCSEPDADSNCTIEVEGCGGKIPTTKAELYVGNAGTAARFLIALVSLGNGEYAIRGDARMHERPMKDLFDALRAHDVVVKSQADRLPATIISKGVKRAEEPYPVELTTSSQFASALLLISQAANLQLRFSKWEVEEGYLTMTENMVHRGYELSFTPDYAIEPDYSSATYFWAAGFVTGGKVRVTAWMPRKYYLQIDGKFPSYLPPRDKVSRRTDLGDSVLTLAVCALFGEQPLRVTDAARLRLQETDRIKAMVTELRRVGAKAEEHEDGFTVWPAEHGQLYGADIETYNDHRMAMCFSVLGLKVPGIRIKNPGCVSKTFPDFFDKLEQLRT